MNIASKQATTIYCLSIIGVSTAAYSNFHTFSQIQSVPFTCVLSQTKYLKLLN